MSKQELTGTGPEEHITAEDYYIHELVAKAFARDGLGAHRFVSAERKDSGYSVIKSPDKTHLEDFERALASAHQLHDSLSRQLRRGGFTVFEVLGYAVNMTADAYKAQEESLEKTS